MGQTFTTTGNIVLINLFLFVLIQPDCQDVNLRRLKMASWRTKVSYIIIF